MLKEINGVRSGLVIEFKSELEEALRFRRYVGGYRRLSGRTDLWVSRQSRRGAGATDSGMIVGFHAYLEDGLHLTQLRPRVFASQHLDDQAPNAPDVCFTCVRRLFHDFGCHPEDGTLE